MNLNRRQFGAVVVSIIAAPKPIIEQPYTLEDARKVIAVTEFYGGREEYRRKDALITYDICSAYPSCFYGAGSRASVILKDLGK